MRSEISNRRAVGTVSLKITDLERKANINTANTAELQQALTVMGVDADDISVVSDSIQDWRSAAAAAARRRCGERLLSKPDAAVLRQECAD